MEKTVYPTQKRYNKALLWIQRLASLVFLYATLTLPEGIQLMDTPLVATLREEYPTWWHVLLDIGITLGVFALLLFLSKVVLYYTRTRHVSKKYIGCMQKVENKFLHNFLNFDFFLVKFFLALLLSLALWFVLKPLLVLYEGFHLPLYSEQPVVFVMVILGFIVLIESFEFWKLKIRKHLHLREKM